MRSPVVCSPLAGRILAFSDVMPELQLTHTKDREEHNLPRNDTECQSMREGLERLPRMKHRPGTELRFSHIPKQTYPEGATPAQITQYSMDLSYALDCLLESHYRQEPLHVLGELQFAFLGEIPPDFFVDIVSQDNFLTSTLQDFFQFATSPGVDGTLRKRAEKFKAHLTKKFRWSFEVDPEESDPVVVELPEGVTLE
ncbi:hypothetical protein SKAU_G00106140 [Synaphobranchus kaupii]|uniref:AAR2 C-terminal domain-containing protein n=1 Tax=Synaphobranchus kaupii TaxID=118154 RepID=A0A9Q1FZI9_SYNKA|nr:hypothetical protein SKAU_G00106140 [Synaphobranchus kaupii]